MAVEGPETGEQVLWQPPAAVDESHNGTLFGTERLNVEETERLLASGSARLVVWMGERGSGKTTICAELYERQRRAATDATFAGSWTLLAFEQLAHQRRSGAGAPPSAHSGPDPGGREILHLALNAGADPLHLLLCDLSGELFRQLADNQLAVAEVPWLQQADRLVLVVDGGRLTDIATRSSTLTRVRQLTERLHSAALPKPTTKLALLVTKWDLVRDDRDAVGYWQPREAELIEELRALDPRAPALHVAADDPAFAEGFAALREWLLDLSPTPDAAEDPFDLWVPTAAAERPNYVEIAVPARKRGRLSWRRA